MQKPDHQEALINLEYEICYLNHIDSPGDDYDDPEFTHYISTLQHRTHKAEKWIATTSFFKSDHCVVSFHDGIQLSDKEVIQFNSFAENFRVMVITGNIRSIGNDFLCENTSVKFLELDLTVDSIGDFFLSDCTVKASILDKDGRTCWEQVQECCCQCRQNPTDALRETCIKSPSDAYIYEFVLNKLEVKHIGNYFMYGCWAENVQFLLILNMTDFSIMTHIVKS